MAHYEGRSVSRARGASWAHGTFHLVLMGVSGLGSLEHHVGPQRDRGWLCWALKQSGHRYSFNPLSKKIV